MKSLILAALSAALLSSAAYAGESKPQTNWGAQTGKGGNFPIDHHLSLSGLAAYVQAGDGLTPNNIYNSTTTITVGSWVDITNNGNNNTIKVDSTNSGPVTNASTQQGPIVIKKTN